jgi:hypothetical protein
MKNNRTVLLTAAMLGTSCLAFPALSMAQAPPGPLPGAQPQPPSPTSAKPQEQPPEVQPRTSILGAWKFNRDESDDARKKMQDARQADRGHGGGGRIGGGIPRIGGGTWGGHRGGGGRETDGDQQGMQELLAAPNAMTIAQKDAEVDITEDQAHKLALFTDGRKIQKSKDQNNQQIAAHWDGTRLVTDEKSPRGGKMSRTYELSYDGKQLYETLLVPVGRSNSQVSIRYVYDQAGGAQTSQISR